MAPDNARAESGTPGAHDEEEDDDADGAADATQSMKTRKPRRPQIEVLAEKVLKSRGHRRKQAGVLPVDGVTDLGLQPRFGEPR